jgi:O-antigen ligase
MRKVGFVIYLFFICSWFLHLPARMPVLGIVRADLVLVGVLALIAVATHSSSAPTINSRNTHLLFALATYVILTVPLVKWPGSVVKAGIPNFMKAFVFFYFTIRFVDTPRKLKYLMTVFIACQTFRVLEPLYLHVTEGYWGDAASMADWEMMDRLAGAPLDVVNSNSLAFIIVTVIPFLHYLTAGSVPGRIVYAGLLPPLLYALTLTASRSGVLALGAVAALVWVKSRHKIVLTVVLCSTVALAVPYLSADLVDRYLSIFSSNTRNAATAEHRWNGVAQDVDVALEQPLFGHGLGTSREANVNSVGRDQPSHNLYTEVGQELGGVGLILYLVFFVSLLASAVRTAAKLDSAPDSVPAMLPRLASAVKVFLGMNLVFSFSSYGLSSYELYFAAGLIETVLCLSQSPSQTVAPRLDGIGLSATSPRTAGGFVAAPASVTHGYAS